MMIINLIIIYIDYYSVIFFNYYYLLFIRAKAGRKKKIKKRIQIRQLQYETVFTNLLFGIECSYFDLE